LFYDDGDVSKGFSFRLR